MILLAETEKGSVAEISSDTENKLLMKAARQRKESADIFQQQNRNDLAEKELLQLEVINRYLPKQLSADELTAELKKIIAEVGATGLLDVGKVMGAATKKLAGKTRW